VPRLYKIFPFRYNAGMMPDMKMTCGGEHARAQHRLVAFLNRFSGL
jgi:hypothetical protein